MVGWCDSTNYMYNKFLAGLELAPGALGVIERFAH